MLHGIKLKKFLIITTIIFILFILMVVLFYDNNENSNNIVKVDIDIISGEVMEINDKIIVISVENPNSINSLSGDNKKINKGFNLSKNTLIFKETGTVKSEEDYNSELKVISANNSEYEAPSWYKLEKINLNEINPPVKVKIYFDNNIVHKILLLSQTFSESSYSKMVSNVEITLIGVITKFDQDQIEIEKDTDILDLEKNKKFVIIHDDQTEFLQQSDKNRQSLDSNELKIGDHVMIKYNFVNNQNIIMAKKVVLIN